MRADERWRGRMSLSKRYLKSRPVCKVTFRLSKEMADWARSAAVVGEFNGWSRKTHPMKKLKDGGFTTTIDLERGQSYQFRYLLDGRVWENDTEADAYVPTVFASQNCVVSLERDAS
jgi:1,4-alpha-glucan branching enzyme